MINRRQFIAASAGTGLSLTAVRSLGVINRSKSSILDCFTHVDVKVEYLCQTSHFTGVRFPCRIGTGAVASYHSKNIYDIIQSNVRQKELIEGSQVIVPLYYVADMPHDAEKDAFDLIKTSVMAISTWSKNKPLDIKRYSHWLCHPNNVPFGYYGIDFIEVPELEKDTHILCNKNSLIYLVDDKNDRIGLACLDTQSLVMVCER